MAALQKAFAIRDHGTGVLIELPAHPHHAVRVVPTGISGGAEVGEALLMPLRSAETDADVLAKKED